MPPADLHFGPTLGSEQTEALGSQFFSGVEELLAARDIGPGAADVFTRLNAAPQDDLIACALHVFLHHHGTGARGDGRAGENADGLAGQGAQTTRRSRRLLSVDCESDVGRKRGCGMIGAVAAVGNRPGQGVAIHAGIVEARQCLGGVSLACREASERPEKRNADERQANSPVEDAFAGFRFGQ